MKLVNSISYMHDVLEFALYFAMEERNVADMCSRSKQTEILLNVLWRGKDVTGL